MNLMLIDKVREVDGLEAKRLVHQMLLAYYQKQFVGATHHNSGNFMDR